MSRRSQFTLIPIVALVFSNGVQTASGMSAKRLISEADQAVIGRAISLVKVGRKAVFQLEVERNVKGALTTGITIPVECDTGTYQVQWAEPASPQRGIWFLTEAAPGRWECSVVDRVQGLLRYPLSNVPAPSALLYDESADPVDKIVLETGAAAMEELEHNPHSYSVLLAIAAAREHDSPAVRRVFRAWADSPIHRLKAFGLAELIKRGDVDALLQFQREAENLPLTPETKTIVSYLDWNRDPTPERIAAFAQLATSKAPIPGVQMAAARVLRFMHTRETLPYLAAFLDSEDPNLRAEGVLGLGFFANGVPLIALDGRNPVDYLNQRAANQYTTEETEKYFGFDESRAEEYIAFWKNWWLQHQAELSQ